jgi:hypothetical protein
MQHKWVSVDKFMGLTVDQEIEVNHFLGKAYIAGEPKRKKEKDSKGDELKFDIIDVRFESGPWKGRTLELLRQHIKRIL